jgi:CheY-like chemotaxis protein
MEVQMPEMDAFECTAVIRAREQTTGVRLPIIAMTAHAMKGDEARCLAAGMDGHLSKPIQPDEFSTSSNVISTSRPSRRLPGYARSKKTIRLGGCRATCWTRNSQCAYRRGTRGSGRLDEWSEIPA